MCWSSAADAGVGLGAVVEYNLYPACPTLIDRAAVAVLLLVLLLPSPSTVLLLLAPATALTCAFGTAAAARGPPARPALLQLLLRLC